MDSVRVNREEKASCQMPGSEMGRRFTALQESFVDSEVNTEHIRDVPYVR
ncbi:MAG: hypothetical protein LUC43_03525 [Burkholderiales bacterium]|nr:hypothetical protein [Burkholderiales bacterium]